ncbi:Hypothetical protein, putative [Bodo saltans]|uniref:Uncharacterized protein n=1 Tax=Bodo saltans TaxID=75058 RepID=A0A0S4JC08_BODSA|nr:Hypothetical protein, putative [Bodo saltans]|eukprot:CUG89083.1 Hypothetical protein, putative [Bodo saltans]
MPTVFPSNAVMELECAEVYSRTIIHCEEADILQRACLGFRRFGIPGPSSFSVGSIEPGSPADVRQSSSSNTVSLPGGGPRINISNSCSVCCKRREIADGTCAHAAEAAASVLRYQQFNEYHADITQRLRAASSRIQSAHLQFVARRDSHVSN